jgi:hypothetical protein
VPEDTATPRPAGSPWYTVHERPLEEELGLGDELAAGEELGLAAGEELRLGEPGLIAATVLAPAVPPVVIQSAAVRPARDAADRTTRLLRIVKA